jgi:cytochrome c peroxidase
MARNVAEKYFLVVVSVQVVIVGPCLLTKISMHCPYLLFGPGRTRLFDPIARDTGRMGESDKFEDAYRFKTPSLRNVTLTAPYGHNGAYPSLEGIVRHHLDPIGMRAKWTRDMANLPPAPWLEDIDFVVQSDQSEINRQKQLIDINKIHLSDDDVSDIILFLKSLTGKTAELGRLGIPDKVPSGLSID